MYTRYLTLEDANNDTVFLWGARQTGKSTLLKTLFPECRYYDLLKGEQFHVVKFTATILIFISF